jgi:nuclear transcription factor Y alpha
MPHFTVNSPAWWNSAEQQQLPMSLSKNLSLKIGSRNEFGQNSEHFGYKSQSQDQDSSSTELTGQSQQELSAAGGSDSPDQCISSDSVSVEDGSQRKRVEDQMKPVMFMGNPGFSMNNLHGDINQSVTHIPYAFADPFGNGLFSAYGPQAIIPAQAIGGLGPSRVPLPLELAEDGPIYVNAKQYHGILRRRQVRARLEAQNKLVKNRKPYLHESRHRHAVNRVRGSGGRFLSTKKSDATSSCNGSGSTRLQAFNIHHPETSNNSSNSPVTSGVSHIINSSGGGTMFGHQTDRLFSGISPRVRVFPAGG